jgi:hypothetical protein
MRCWALLLASAALGVASDQTQVLRGRLRQPAGKPPVIETSEGKAYTVSGDKFTTAQMADPKLKDRELELEGRFGSPSHFEAAQIFTIKEGKRHKATYWCDVCSIRTHMPGRCMCCQADTELQELPLP